MISVLVFSLLLNTANLPYKTVDCASSFKHTDLGLCLVYDYQGVQSSCSRKIEKMIRYAKSFIGTPYLWAANGPDSFDCSGFVRFVYAHIGYDLPRNSRSQSQVGIQQSIHTARKGDLIFFVSGTTPPIDITHVGIIISDADKNGDFQFIHANHGAGCVSISNFSEPYFQSHYGGCRRVIQCE